MSRERQQPAVAPTLDISNVVAAFSEDQIERMIGLSKSRLRYWAKTDFFRPSFVEEDGRRPNSRFYSFKDAVALRTLEMLRIRNNVPLQHLRKVAEKLAHLKDDLWTKTTLFVVNKTVIVVNPEESAYGHEVLSGQYLIEISLARVIEDTNADVVALRSRPPNSEGKISRKREVVGNAWVVAGTRIPVASIVRLAEDGYGVEQIISEYPDLTREDVEAALSHGAKAAA